MEKAKLIIVLCMNYTYCYTQPSKYSLDTKLLGLLPNQQKTKTCVGWSIVYGLLSYDRNINIKNKDSIFYFNPCYNFTNDNCSKNGIQTEDILNSIRKKGLTFLPKQVASCSCYEQSTNAITVKNNKVLKNKVNNKSPININDLKAELYYRKRGFVIQYSSEDNLNLDQYMG